MSESLDEIQTIEELRSYVHRNLCEKENLLADQFAMTEIILMRGERACGLQFSLQGPRSVRLGAIWTADQNQVFFYDAQGERWAKVRLRHRFSLPIECDAA
ncbi:MAG: hypothetical protein KDA84_21860 [Planctomycetaceae bacterium]|nr:hypothetical protein [Planctomycetaceae bacterium]